MALKKARIVTEFTGETVLADDSGLEVDVLDGRPGIFSARYAGPNATDEENIQKLLEALRGVPPEKRGAAFRCVLVLYRPDSRFETFDGHWQGKISERSLETSGIVLLRARPAEREMRLLFATVGPHSGALSTTRCRSNLNSWR